MSKKEMLYGFIEALEPEDLDALTDTEFGAHLLLCKLLSMPESKQKRALYYLFNVFDHMKAGIYT